jgi:hypothetical protein
MVDDQIVWRIVNDTLRNHATAGVSITVVTQAAWLDLRTQRRTIAPSDENLAAAEHYMYARFLTGVTGDPLVRAAPTVYEIKKWIYFKLGKEKSMRTDPNHPVLPPSMSSVAWGNQGVIDGRKDYRGEHPGAYIGSVGDGVKSLAGDAY